jgi:hypothetical protein
MSNISPILRGVNPGSILRPVLFSLSIIDQLELVMFSQAHFYADVVQIFVSGDLFVAAREIEISPNYGSMAVLCLITDKLKIRGDHQQQRRLKKSGKFSKSLWRNLKSLSIKDPEQEIIFSDRRTELTLFILGLPIFLIDSNETLIRV